MGGTLPLCKKNPTDRVTGTVHAIGYLHLPLLDTIETVESFETGRKVPIPATPARRPIGEGIQENNSHSVNSLTPPSTSKKLIRHSTPPSTTSEMKVALQKLTPNSNPSEALTASERRRRKQTLPIVHPPVDGTEDGGNEEINRIVPKYSYRSESPPSQLQPPTVGSFDLPAISSVSLSSNQHSLTPTFSQTPKRPSTAPNRMNRIAEQLNKLESLASTLQVDAETAMQSLNKKLMDRIEEKNETVVQPLETLDQNTNKGRKIVLKNSSESFGDTRASQLEDADVLLASLRRRLNEKKAGK
jgi:hypothetical protein